MAVSYDSWESAAVGIVVTMLARCALWQTLTSAANETEALAFIIEHDGGISDGSAVGTGTASDGSSLALAAPYAVIGMPEPASHHSIGIGVWESSGAVRCTLVLSPGDTGDTPAEAIRRTMNRAGTIRAQLEAQRGSSGALYEFTTRLSAVEILTGPQQSAQAYTIDIDLEITG